MKTRTPRMVAFFCAVALALPSPTFAFHPIESSEGRQHAGLEHSLQSSGLEEQIKGQRLADAVGLDKLVVHYSAGVSPDFSAASVVLVTADAGMGTRFSPSGEQLKMLALVGGLPAGVRTKRFGYRGN